MELMIQLTYFILNIFQLMIGASNYNNINGQLIIDGFMNNQIVVSTNNFKMPVYDPYADVNQYVDGFHELNPKDQNFSFLGDWILIPVSPTGQLQQISIGDIEIMQGLTMITWNQLFQPNKSGD